MAEQDDASTLLFLHPVGLDKHSIEWMDLPPTRAVTFPGHGDRRRARPGLTLEDMADEIAGHSTGPLDVVGASLGGMVAMHFALAHPERVRSLVLACTTASGSPEALEARASATETRGSVDMLDETMARWFTPTALQTTPDAAPLEYARRRLLAMDAGALADTWRAIGGLDLAGRLAEIRVPVTCIAGIHDLSTSLEVMRDLAAGLPNSRLVELDAPHMAFLEKPKEFSEAVRAHLDWVEEKA